MKYPGDAHRFFRGEWLSYEARCTGDDPRLPYTNYEMKISFRYHRVTQVFRYVLSVRNDTVPTETDLWAHIDRALRFAYLIDDFQEVPA